MPPQTAQQDGHTDAANALVLYDMLMQHIEPELCSTQLITLDERYVGETPEQHDERMNRYEFAYAIFDEAVKVLDDDVSFVSEAMRAAALEQDKSKSAVEDTETLKKLEIDIDTDTRTA